MATVLCMKWGEQYGPEYVNALHAMVRRHVTRPVRVVCLTDDRTGIVDGVECRPLPAMQLAGTPGYSGWRKLSCFSPELADLEGRVLFLDLDLVIVDNIDGFFDLEGRFCIIENWTQKGRGIGNSSVYRYEGGDHREVFERFQEHAADVVRTYPNEQVFLSKAVGNLTYWPETWCRSFKHHCLPGRPIRWLKAPTIPDGARIIVFHGQPKPPDAARGTWPQSFRKLRPAPWIVDHWR